MTLLFGAFIGLFLAYANGANDNFKGVATLFGSGTTSYGTAIRWATVTTALGSVFAIFLANGLLEAFKGKGLVPESVAGMSSFSISVALAAALTVMLATRIGFPVSTTHAIIGALVGAGLMASSEGVFFGKLGSKFLLPLLVSPVLAVIGTMMIYPVLRFLRRKAGIERETCLCVGTEILHVVPESPSSASLRAARAHAMEVTGVHVGSEVECRQRYSGKVAGITAEAVVDRAHFLSSGLVSFARGLNDAPKIAAIMLAGGALSPSFAIGGVAVLMAAGGLLSARRVAETMSHRVTEMNHGQGLTANVITGMLVIVASRFGLPVSTTHVSCGSLFGIGAVTRQAHWKIIATILAAWIITLPLAGILGALFFQLTKALWG